MAVTRKPRPAPRASATGKTVGKASESKASESKISESKAAAKFRLFKEAREAAAAASEGGTTASSSSPSGAWSAPPMTALPPWAMTPSFSLPQLPPGWGGMLPQPGLVQPAPLAAGSLGDRLGSTLRLGIDVINMALVGSLRLLGGIGHGNHEHGDGGYCGCGSHSCAEHCGSYDCCCVFEHNDCCTPSVGNCCD